MMTQPELFKIEEEVEVNVWQINTLSQSCLHIIRTTVLIRIFCLPFYDYCHRYNEGIFSGT